MCACRDKSQLKFTCFTDCKTNIRWEMERFYKVIKGFFLFFAILLYNINNCCSMRSEPLTLLFFLLSSKTCCRALIHNLSSFEDPVEQFSIICGDNFDDEIRNIFSVHLSIFKIVANPSSLSTWLSRLVLNKKPACREKSSSASWKPLRVSFSLNSFERR